MDFSDQNACDEWIRTLPLSDVRAAARAIDAMVRELNNSQIVLRHHFDFLERIGPSVYQVLRHLERYYADAHFPLAPSARNAARMSDDLAELMVISYQSVMREITTSDLGSSADDPRLKVWDAVAHRIIYYSQRILANQLLLDLEDRANFWLRIYRIYRASLTLSDPTRVIGFPGVEDYPNGSVADLTKRVLLISLVPLRSLRNTQVRELFRSAGVWSKSTELHTCKGEVDRKQTPFLFDPHQDIGPSYAVGRCNECPGPRCILVHTATLNEKLNQLLLTAAREGTDRVELTPGLTVSISTLDALKGYWKDRSLRTDHRNESEETVDVVLGISAIQTALEAGEGSEQAKAAAGSGAPRPKRQIVFTEMSSQSLEAMFAKSMEQQNAEQKRLNKEAQEQHVPVEELEYRKRQEKGHLPAYHFYPSKVKDFSRHGYRLELAHHGDLRMRIGEILAIRTHGREGFTLGVVRWIRELDETTVSFGVLIIAHNPEPATFHTGNGKNPIDLPCLIAEHARSGKTVLILDHLPSVRDHLITLIFNGEKIPIAFNGWPVEESRSFEAYEFGIRKASKNIPNPKLPMLDLMALRAITQKDDASSSDRPADEAHHIDPSDNALWHHD